MVLGDGARERMAVRAEAAKGSALDLSEAQGERRPAGKDFGRQGAAQARITTTEISLRNLRQQELDPRWFRTTA